MNSLTAVIPGLQSRAAAAQPTSLSRMRGFQHAAKLCAKPWSAGRVLRQLRQHAGFWADRDEDKACAYRESIGLIARETGERETTVVPDFALTS
ncbi:hypothetical protein OKA04_23280 [Luteolibacter flavescens]|uniref:Uncharacterized protein n=1 Tax=Luteolibacter flavescens TaxID=1859460 RepID=A0ABT3FVS4_9BACT|nr:hypothetical protein [Luteolibacter flavescens]MCW1887679.1 hypothetical protein [Luteolibacter flavescens]